MKTFKKSIAIMLLLLSLVFVNGCKIIVGAEDEDKNIINSVAENGIMTANVNVIAKNNFNVPSALGSGVVYFKETKGLLNYYYVLTNNHVIHNLSYFEVYDAYGNVFKASLLAKDSAYDLAVLFFASEKDYYVPKIKNEKAHINDKVVCLGSPNGLLNSVTLGEVVKYTKVSVDGGELTLDNGGSQIEFEVIEHSAPINQGSSGGVVLDYNFNIVAINFAATREDETNEFLSAYAVPSLRIIEFLEANELA